MTDEVWKAYIENQKPNDPAFSRNSKPPALAGGCSGVKGQVRMPKLFRDRSLVSFLLLGKQNKKYSTDVQRFATNGE